MATVDCKDLANTLDRVVVGNNLVVVGFGVDRVDGSVEGKGLEE